MQGFLKEKDIVFRKVLQCHLQWFQDHQKTRHGAFEILSDSLLESNRLNIRSSSGNAETRNEGDDSAWRDTTSSESNESIKSRIVPVKNVFLFDEFKDLSFGHDSTSEVETSIF